MKNKYIRICQNFNIIVFPLFWNSEKVFISIHFYQLALILLTFVLVLLLKCLQSYSFFSKILQFVQWNFLLILIFIFSNNFVYWALFDLKNLHFYSLFNQINTIISGLFLFLYFSGLIYVFYLIKYKPITTDLLFKDKFSILYSDIL